MLTLPPPISCGVAKALKVQANAVVTPATMPGTDSGSVTVRKTRIGPAPRRARGLLVVAVDVGERGRQHDHHDRQRHMHERDDHAEGGEHQLQRLLDQAGLEQHRVDEAVVAEHDDPGIGAHHLAEEQRGDGR